MKACVPLGRLCVKTEDSVAKHRDMVPLPPLSVALLEGHGWLLASSPTSLLNSHHFGRGPSQWLSKIGVKGLASSTRNWHLMQNALWISTTLWNDTVVGWLFLPSLALPRLSFQNLILFAFLTHSQCLFVRTLLAQQAQIVLRKQVVRRGDRWDSPWHQTVDQLVKSFPGGDVRECFGGGAEDAMMQALKVWGKKWNWLVLLF